MEEKKEVYTLRLVEKNAWAEMNGIQGHYIDQTGTPNKTMIGIPLDERTGQIKDIFTPEEKEFLCKQLGLQLADLNPDSVWLSERPVILTKKERKFYPDENPLDKIYVNILKANTKLVATNEHECGKEGVKYLLINKAEDVKRVSKSTNEKAKAYSLFTQMTIEEKIGLLAFFGKKMYGFSHETIDAKLGQEIESDPKKVIVVYTDPNFKEKVFVQTLIVCGVLRAKTEGIVYNDDFLGSDIDEALRFIKDPKNKLVLDSLKEAMAKLNKA